MLIPESWLSKVSMDRIINHWTAGSYDVSEIDRDHYHIIIDGKGKIHKGHNSIASNSDGAYGPYAAHTYMLNTRSIGVSCACMANATKANKGGKYPLNEAQWKSLIEVNAQLCLFYKLQPTIKQVLMHGDVSEYYGIDQGGKWDINYLPFKPELGHYEVGDLLRREVSALMNSNPRDQPSLVFNGKQLSSARLIDNTTYVSARELVEALGMQIMWNAESKIATIKGKEE